MRVPLLLLLLLGPPEELADDPAVSELPDVEAEPAAPGEGDAGEPEAPVEPELVEPELVEPEAPVEPELVEPEPLPEPPLPSIDDLPPPQRRQPRVLRCLPGVEPCYRTTSARLLLTAGGALATATSVALIFTAGDRNRIGDPALGFAGAGVIALGAAALGGAVALLGGDGPSIPDRITVPTFALGVGLGGSGTTDESAPYSLSGSFAPTLEFPRDRGRVRLIGGFAGDLGTALERDPRPQQQVADNGAGGTFPVATQTTGWRGFAGVDLALRLPYSLTPRRPGWLGQLELRYKPLFMFARDRLRLGADEQERISERVAMAPLTFGFRWHISPRQRFTFYLGPRWDMNGYGTADAVAVGKPAAGPLYSEAWFDLDVPMLLRDRALARNRKATVVGQLTLGYVHSRFEAPGMNFGSIVGFLGYMVAQYAIRVRPLGSAVAYQFDIGARIGGGLNPYVRVGIVLPSILPGSGHEREQRRQR